MQSSALHALDQRFPPGKRILHVGRRSRQKNIETVIGALPLLPQDYMAVFIGRGDATPYTALAKTLGVEIAVFG